MAAGDLAAVHVKDCYSVQNRYVTTVVPCTAVQNLTAVHIKYIGTIAVHLHCCAANNGCGNLAAVDHSAVIHIDSTAGCVNHTLVATAVERTAKQVQHCLGTVRVSVDAGLAVEGTGIDVCGRGVEGQDQRGSMLVVISTAIDACLGSLVLVLDESIGIVCICLSGDAAVAEDIQNTSVDDTAGGLNILVQIQTDNAGRTGLRQQVYFIQGNILSQIIVEDAALGEDAPAAVIGMAFAVNAFPCNALRATDGAGFGQVFACFKGCLVGFYPGVDHFHLFGRCQFLILIDQCTFHRLNSCAFLSGSKYICKICNVLTGCGEYAALSRNHNSRICSQSGNVDDGFLGQIQTKYLAHGDLNLAGQSNCCEAADLYVAGNLAAVNGNSCGLFSIGNGVDVGAGLCLAAFYRSLYSQLRLFYEDITANCCVTATDSAVYSYNSTCGSIDVTAVC